MKNFNQKKILQYIGESAIAVLVFSLFLFFFPDKNDRIETNATDSGLQFIFHDSAEDREVVFDEYELDDILTGELKDEIIIRLEEETTEVKDKNKPCSVPWMNQKIDHGEYVLAYEQRNDVPNICNVERRICVNGTLLGSYTQRACKENLVYNYTKEPVISYNTEVSGPLIQPTAPPYKDANFTTDGKRYGYQAQSTYRNNGVNDANIGDPRGNGQVPTNGRNCIAPRGDIVNNRQFVKAYKSAFGFTNALCEVELRYCLDGELDGSFEYQYCEHTEMSRADYILQSQDEKQNYQKTTIFQLINGAIGQQIPASL